jgi:hypothetical protein
MYMKIDEKGFVAGTNADSSRTDEIISVSQTIGNAVLGEVLFKSSSNMYHVKIDWGGQTYDWYVERCRTEHLHYTNTLGIWCSQRFHLKTSVKRKMKRIVEDAVKNLA